MSNKVLIIGAGAIGAFYGALLAKAGADVAVVCRSDYQHVRQHGFTITSTILGHWHFMPSQVLQNVEDFNGTADYVVLCTKVLPSLNRVELIRPAVKPNTAIVFIQNGVDIEQDIRDAFPNQELISGLAFICCNRIKPGEIHHLAYGRLVLGNISDGISAKTTQLCDLFKRSGIDCAPSETIVTERWKKCIWNAPFNPLSVLSGGLSTLDILRSQETLVRHIMQDVFNVAMASGHRLPDTIIDTHISSTYAMPPYKTSMLLDYENGRVMETEAIIGNAFRVGQRMNLATPYLESVYGLLKLRELTFVKR